MGMEAYKKRWEAVQQNKLQGHGGQGRAKYQELKVNMEHLHIGTGSPILTDEQLMFEDAGGSNKDHRRGGSSSSSSIPLISSAVDHEACIERERRLWGYMQQAQDKFVGFMTSFTSQCGVYLDSVPTLFLSFLSPNDDATSQIPTSPPSSSSPPPPI
ncbi:hypothetical protein M9H77_18229 [Catharanthus roseus]|uniref:Uncharacterized protein n=1 Tax=Catharanthus roseus TaxID=4058 RepID=A0ACC0B6V8_CATRO|nr:hypothetical protein M9H77_18229 [Catharanthus roseus]